MAISITITTLGLIGTNDWRNAKQNANRAVETFTVKELLNSVYSIMSQLSHGNSIVFIVMGNGLYLMVSISLPEPPAIFNMF